MNKLDENGAFITFDNTAIGLLFDDSNHKDYPIKYYNVINGIGINPEKNKSYYGFVYEGVATLISEDRPQANLCDGMYFSLNGVFVLNPTCEGKVVIIEVMHEQGIYPQTNYRAMYHVGGPTEPQGRLKYIDGCTDSLLIPPVKLGDPCFNHLHFPKNIDQTQHTHPSHRIGIVISGQGRCVTPFGDLPLEKGMIFVIKMWDNVSYEVGLDGKDYPVGQHAFETRDYKMNVIAFHPDSDFGATDVFHPMINRTIVDGVSANKIDKIRTK
jgi:hypothetical protein